MIKTIGAAALLAATFACASKKDYASTILKKREGDPSYCLREKGDCIEVPSSLFIAGEFRSFCPDETKPVLDMQGKKMCSFRAMRL